MTLTFAQRFRPAAKIVAISALVFGAIFFASSTRYGTRFGISHAAGKELSPKDRAAVLEDVWKNVRDRYYDPEFHGVNWDDVGKHYRPLVDGVKNYQ